MSIYVLLINVACGYRGIPNALVDVVWLLGAHLVVPCCCVIIIVVTMCEIPLVSAGLFTLLRLVTAILCLFSIFLYLIKIVKSEL